MIYTVTFNPSLDYIVAVDDFQLGLTNRTSSELILPGGKGINVSTLLMNLGIESTALGFMAGFTGDEIVRELQEMGVKSDFIRIDEGISRINFCGWRSCKEGVKDKRRSCSLRQKASGNGGTQCADLYGRRRCRSDRRRRTGI